MLIAVEFDNPVARDAAEICEDGPMWCCRLNLQSRKALGSAVRPQLPLLIRTLSPKAPERVLCQRACCRRAIMSSDDEPLRDQGRQPPRRPSPPVRGRKFKPKCRNSWHSGEAIPAGGIDSLEGCQWRAGTPALLKIVHGGLWARGRKEPLPVGWCVWRVRLSGLRVGLAWWSARDAACGGDAFLAPS